jgi:hypothetical protein
MSNFDQFSNVNNASIVLVAGDTYRQYFNLDTLETSGSFVDWHFDLLTDGFATAYADIGILTKDELDGGYRFYVEFVVPSGIPPGCYYLAVVDEFYNQVNYLSNVVEYSTITDYTKIVRFRNNKNILNYNYEVLTSFYNQFRIKVQQRHQTPNINATGYDLINGSFNPVRYTQGSSEEFITLWYDKEDHEAFNAMTIHSDFYVEDGGEMIQYIRGENDYSIDWQQNYPLAEGSIRMQRKDSYTSNKTL